MKKLLALCAFAAMLYGCASTTSGYKASRQISQKTPEKIMFFGAYKSTIVGTVTWETESHCSDIKFIMQMRKERKADNLIDILSEERCSTVGPDTRCACSYVGTALKYMPLKPEEAEEWNLALNAPKKKEPPKPEIVPVPCEAPAPVVQKAPIAEEPANSEAVEEVFDTTEENLDNYPKHR